MLHTQDGLGGGNTVEQNLLFNMVRETNDHGAFNSWDRCSDQTALEKLAILLSITDFVGVFAAV